MDLTSGLLPTNRQNTVLSSANASNQASRDSRELAQNLLHRIVTGDGSAGFKPLTAKQAAGNILGFIQRQLERDVADGASQEDLNARLEAGLSGFKKGFAQAQKRLQALDKLSPEVAQDIGKTYDLVTDGIDKMARHYVGHDLAGHDLAGHDLPTKTAPASTSDHTVKTSVSASYQYASAQRFEFTLTTADGDKVNISAAAQRAQSSSVQAGDNSATYNASNSRATGYRISVDGELNDSERAAVNSLIGQVSDLADQFFTGDVAGAVSSAQQLGYNQREIKGFAVNLTRTEVQRVSAAYQRHTEAPAGLQQSLKPVGEFMQSVRSALDSAQVFANPQQVLADIADGIFAHGDTLGNADGKSFVDFLHSLLNIPPAADAAHSERKT